MCFQINAKDEKINYNTLEYPKILRRNITFVHEKSHSFPNGGNNWERNNRVKDKSEKINFIHVNSERILKWTYLVLAARAYY